MSDTYTKNDWSEVLPVETKEKLDLQETGIKRVNDERDKESTPGRALVEAADVAAQRTALGLGTAALAGDASESAKGVVQLAATGVPSATKVPKALGADLVALITAAGYTLNPATGTASLDGIADGTTYKRILAAIATALNASKLPLITGVTDLNNGLYDSCIFTCAGNPTGGPVNLAYSFPTGIQILQGNTPAYNIQIIHENTTESLYVRYCDGGVWPATWRKIWSNFNDGNGGQPPAPKPTTSGIGKWAVAASNLCANGESGGTYAVIAFSSSDTFIGATAGRAQGADLDPVFGTTVAKHLFYRTA